MLREEILQLEGARFHYYQGGISGPPVILLHGGGTDSALLSWKLTFPALVDRYRVYLPNWPGYGQSTPLAGDYATADLATALAGMLDAWQLETAHLVGVSMGGGAALGYALRFPERVNKLVLVDSYGLHNRAPAHLVSYALVRIPQVIPLSWRLVRSSRWMTRWALRAIFWDPAAVIDDLVEEVYAAVRNPGTGEAFYQWQRGEMGWNRLNTNYMAELDRLAVPTLLIHGENDPLVPWRSAQRAAERIKDGRLCLINDCGHWPQREKPEEFNRVLRAFLG
jgi:pimeloyl-ACP methyl ester carboxylesterase